MADIVTADAAKLKFRILVSMLTKTGGVKHAHEDMRNCSNAVFKEVYLETMKVANGIKRGHQQAIVADLGTWLIWNNYKDTAYNPISLYILKKLINNKKFVDAVNEQAVDDINDLYVNRWAKSLEATASQHNENVLNKFDLSRSEQTYVPSVQHKKHLDMSNKEYEKQLLDKADKEAKKIFRQR